MWVKRTSFILFFIFYFFCLMKKVGEMYFDMRMEEGNKDEYKI